MGKGFLHLHVHTQYSLLEGALRVSDAVQRARELGMPALAITDHGNMFGAVDFYLAAQEAGIKPIIGAEIYYTTGSRFSKAALPRSRHVTLSSDAEDSARSYRLVLLCKNEDGYRNLCELVTRGYTEGLYHDRPRVDRELLGTYRGGLIALTSGLKGEVAFHCAHGRPDRGEAAALALREIYGDGLYLELQENGLPPQSQANSLICEFAGRLGIPTVATADVHYLKPEDAVAHEVLMCVGAGRNHDPGAAARLSPDEFWFKDETRMREQFRWHEEAVDNTLRVAQACDFSFRLKDEKGRQIYHLPEFRPERAVEGFRAEAYLREQAARGLEERLAGTSKDHAAYARRLSEELDMIVKTGFAGYFLVVADFIGYAKANGIPVGPGRGSGAGSLVAWSLKITDIDPIPFNLLFERFINPERISLPDFDVDFCQDRRQEVIDYVVGKYGREMVAQIVTFGKMHARSVIRDVGRVLGIPLSEVNAIAKLVPEELGMTLERALEMEPRLKEMIEQSASVARLFEIARRLEGLGRNASVHAAGVVITNRPIVGYCPLMAGKEGEAVVQYDKDFAEKIGLVKFDFLGLKTLTVIDNAVKLAREAQAAAGVPEERRFRLDRIDYTDAKVYELISRGDTDGVFQLESSGMKDLCARVQPSSLEDITAINALYRPGPLESGMVDDFINRKHGRTPVVYELPQLASILEETYGVIVYQEQVMRVARVLAGYSLGEADILRRAMGKKKPEEMAKQRDKFLKGCAATNQRASGAGASSGAEAATRIFDLLAQFAHYGFNKSHSAAYGVLSFQTACLKAYHPAPFMAALMATEMGDTDKMAQYIADARRRGISILPPDVNASKKTFSVVDDAIRFGLEAIKGVGGVAVDVILEERAAHGPFRDFVDFCCRVPTRKVNKKVIECLISAGSFDSISGGETRATLFASIEGVSEHAAKHQESHDLGQVSIFDQYRPDTLKLETPTAHLLKRAPDWPETRKLQLEKQLMGFYVSGHPMEKWWPAARAFVSGDLEWLNTEFDRRKASLAPSNDEPRWEVTLALLASSFREIMTKKGKRMAFAEFEDARSRVEGVCFPEAYEKHGELLKQSVDQCVPLVVTGNVELRDEAPKVLLRTIERLEDYQRKRVGQVVLKLDIDEVSSQKLAQLKGLLLRHRGKCAAFLEYSGTAAGSRVASRLALPKELSVSGSAEMVSEVNALFGREVVRLV